MFRDAFPILYTQHVARLAAFYARLGSAETYRFPMDGEPWFVALRLGDTALGIGLPPEWARRSGELCIYTDDVDAAVAVLGAPLLQEPADQPWGERNAYVADPDGNPVHIAQRHN